MVITVPLREDGEGCKRGGGGGLCIHERLVGKKLDLQGYF